VGESPAALDEAAVYPTALTPERISSHWTAGDSLASSPCRALPTGPYPTAVLADKPLRYLRLDDLAAEPATRVAFDSSGHCTSSAPTSGSYSAEGVGSLSQGALVESNPATTFTKNGSVRLSANTLPSFPAVATYEVWFQSKAANFDLISGQEAGVSYVTNNGKPEIVIPAGTDPRRELVLSRAYNDGNWHLLDLVVTNSSVPGGGARLDVYLDGAFENAAGQLNPTGTGALYVGSFPGGVGESPAALDEAAVYPEALTAGQISAHYKAASTTLPPSVVTVKASGLTGTIATLNGEVNPNGFTVTDCHFEYGTDTTYGNSVSCAQAVGSGNSPVAVTASLTNLASGATFHFRLVATSHGVTVMGGDEVFKTTNALITTTTSVTSTANPILPGVAVTYTATVSAPTSANGTPTGSVKFEDGASPIAGCDSVSLTPTATAGTAAVVCRVPRYAATGIHPIVASYSGATAFAASVSAPLTETVSVPRATVTGISSGRNPSAPGTLVTYLALVRDIASLFGNPTGTVAFTDGSAPIAACANQPLSPFFAFDAIATCNVRYPTAGVHVVVALYSGDSNFARSTSARYTQRVVARATVTGIFSAPNPSAADGKVTFLALVRDKASLFGNPTGTVAFQDGSTSIPGCGSRPVSSFLGVFGAAICSVPHATPGTHAVTALYSGDNNFAGSKSNPLTQHVVATPPPPRRNTATSVTSSTNPSAPGEQVIYFSTVSATGSLFSNPTGTVVFKEGGVPIPQCSSKPLASYFGAFAIADCPVKYSNTGKRAVEAVYGGDANFNPSTSNRLTQSVIGGPTTSQLGSYPNPSSIGDRVAYSVIIWPPDWPAVNGIPTGTVAFQEHGSPIKGCESTPVSPLAGGPEAEAACIVPYATPGTHTVVAVYSGDNFFAASTSNAQTQNVIAPPPPTITAITPNHDPPTGGLVEIHGAGFNGATKVIFGSSSTSAVYFVGSPTVIYAIAPAHPALGAVHVTVTTPWGTSVPTPADIFTYDTRGLSPYPAAVITDQPSVYWRVGESGCCATDVSGNGRFGTYSRTGEVEFMPGALPGDPATSMGVANGDLSASPPEAVAYRPSSSGLPGVNAPRTIELWFRSALPQTAGPLVSYGEDAVTGKQFQVRVEASGTRLTVDGGLFGVSFALPAPLAARPTSIPVPNGSKFNYWTGPWHMLDIVFDGTHVQVYEDAKPVGGPQALPGVDTTPQGQLAVGGTGGDYQDFALYPTALAGSQILAHFNAAQTPATSGFAVTHVWPDDAAVDLEQTITVYGSGFHPGDIVTVGGVQASKTTYISGQKLEAVVPHFPFTGASTGTSPDGAVEGGGLAPVGVLHPMNNGSTPSNTTPFYLWTHPIGQLVSHEYDNSLPGYRTFECTASVLKGTSGLALLASASHCTEPALTDSAGHAWAFAPGYVGGVCRTLALLPTSPPPATGSYEHATELGCGFAPEGVWTADKGSARWGADTDPNSDWGFILPNNASDGSSIALAIEDGQLLGGALAPEWGANESGTWTVFGQKGIAFETCSATPQMDQYGLYLGQPCQSVAQPGASGGPVLNDKNHVVAVSSKERNPPASPGDAPAYFDTSIEPHFCSLAGTAYPCS
jgi:hypothetical protein